jgi:hypothetical protein
MTKKVPSKDRFMDWDYMLYQWMSVFLKKHKNVEIEIPKAAVHIFEVANRNILIMHGDSVKGKGAQTRGVPALPWALAIAPPNRAWGAFVYATRGRRR